MSNATVLDTAHAAMMQHPEDVQLRMSFYAILADIEVFLLLDAEPKAEMIEPQIIEVDGTRFVLGFDSAERLSAFSGGPAPYAALSGRIMVQMLAAEGAGLALNLEVAPSSIMLPHEAMLWMRDTLKASPQEAEPAPKRKGGLAALKSPNIPEVLLHALDAKLSRAAGLANVAYLVAKDEGGMMLAILGAKEPAQAPLAKAASEALVFSGLEDTSLDVAFFNDSEALRAQFARAGLRFDVPKPAEPASVQIAAPGSDPAKPPRLR